MWMPVGFKDCPLARELAKTVEKAEWVAAGDGLVEFADENATVVRVYELDDEFAFQAFWSPACQRFGGW